MDKYKPTKEELKVINDRFAKEPYESIDNLYVFPAMIVDTLLTAYYTKMHPDFLKQCVKDLAKGVPFLIGHDKDKLPMARSFKGTSITHNDEMEVFAKFFMQRDLEINGVNTDNFMRAYLGGTIEDVSISFAAKRWECSICEEDIRMLKCPHWPGKRYNAKDEEVDKGGKLCFAWVKEPAGPTGEALLEISAVYKGAVPKAGLRRPSETPKFSIELTAGKKLKEIEVDTAITMNFSVPVSPLKEKPEELFNIDKFFASEYTAEELKTIQIDVAAILARASGSKTAEAEKLKISETNNGVLLEQITGLKAEIVGYKQVIDKSEIEIQKIKDTNLKLQEKVKELESFAGIVKTYREELITEILDLGVKLHGNSYDKETNEKMLKESTRTLDEIKKIREQYLKELDTKFPRKQTAGSDLQLESGEKQEIPDAAFEQK